MPCGKYTGSYAVDVRFCAITGGSTTQSRSDPQECWNHCANSANCAAIVWKKGTCGCVHPVNLGKCKVGDEKHFEYYEFNPSHCKQGNLMYDKYFHFKNIKDVTC